MLDKTYIKIAKTIASESKCAALKVGAVIAIDGRIVSTGYNGTPHGHENCCDYFQRCGYTYNSGSIRDEHRQHHREWSKDHEVHAEMNAILAAARKGVSIDGGVLYVTHSPCNDCAKAIAQSGIKKVVYNTPYTGANPDWEQTLIRSKVEVYQL